MYKIIYMVADFEPWWLFEGWESSIISIEEYQSEVELHNALETKLNDFRKKYQHEASKEKRFFAFWNEDEVEFCEACDDDSQIYHGIIVETL